MVLSTVFAAALMLAPSGEPQRPASERITAPPPAGGAPSGGAPPPAPRIVEAPLPTTRSRPADLGLERLEDGSYRYVDPQRRFTMTVAPDGRAYFADRWRRPSSADSQNGKIGRRPGAPSFVSNSGGFAMQGPLEWLIRASGHDLSTSAKMAALRETEAFRIDLAVAWNRAQIGKRLRELPADLLAVWGDDALSVERKREILFDHWDACEDRLGLDTGGIPADALLTVDRMRREAGNEARAVIEDFVRRELVGEDEAFTTEEMLRFNARRISVLPFDPYAPEPEPEPEPSPASTPDAASDDRDTDDETD